MKIPREELAIIILHYGDEGTTGNCLNSLDEKDGAQIFVVNNDEKIFSNGFSRSMPDGVKIISTGKNLGYAGGMNFGIKKAVEDGARYLAIFNNDILFTPGFIEKLKETFKKTEDDKIAFSPLILDLSGEKIWFGGGKLSWLLARAKHQGFNSGEMPEALRESDFLSGCAFCFTKESVESAGYLNEDYFLYWEDVDWSLRFRNKGYKLAVYPDLKISHFGSRTTGLESEAYLYYFHRNQLRFLFRNCPPLLLPFSLT